MSGMDSIIGKHKAAADKAISNVGRAIGYAPIKVEDQLAAYRNMTPSDFDLFSKTYGLSDTLGYIARMEALRGGNHG